MRIALINENSQAAKNEMIYASLKKVAESKEIGRASCRERV